LQNLTSKLPVTVLSGFLGAWNNHFNGVVHRSPLSDEDRLLLSLDPIFE